MRYALCGIYWIAVASIYTGSVVIAYGLGWRTARRRYASMLERAGSRFTREY